MHAHVHLSCEVNECLSTIVPSNKYIFGEHLMAHLYYVSINVFKFINKYRYFVYNFKICFIFRKCEM